ncbi:MAG: thioredoxin family protein [Kiritimatiellae bacterium]|nr:thioredoxin family protein [Kiritimatiellia bacterium]
MKTIIIAMMAILATTTSTIVSVQAAEHAHRASDFKVKLIGVAAASAEKDDEKVTPLSPETRIVVPPGKLAMFFLEYDFPEDVKSHLFLGANFDKSDTSENPFGSSGSGLYSGKGRLQRILIIMPEDYGQPIRLQSVRISGEIQADEDAPRNNSFFICDFPVEVLFAKETDKDSNAVKVLQPSPAPAPDPTLGIIPAEKVKRAEKTSSTPIGFTDNLDKALVKAKSEGKLVYTCFSGSDWCGWCMKLEKEVLSQPAFLTGITNDFVLVFIDLPQNKKLLSQHARTANKGLVEKYHIEGFPTALILDPDGRTIGMTGYMRGGPKAYVKLLMEFRKNKATGIIENK